MSLPAWHESLPIARHIAAAKTNPGGPSSSTASFVRRPTHVEAWLQHSTDRLWVLATTVTALFSAAMAGVLWWT